MGHAPYLTAIVANNRAPFCHGNLDQQTAFERLIAKTIAKDQVTAIMGKLACWAGRRRYRLPSKRNMPTFFTSREADRSA